MGSKPTVTVVPDPDALADAAARLIAEAAADAIEARGRFMWALAGGETPRATYARLALPPFRERVDWRRVWVFFGDERAVPPDHPDSNYRMAHETLLGKVPIPAAQVLRIRGEAEDLEVAAAEYAGALGTDRKSTRLNSSHLGISYAVFCLKKKKRRFVPLRHRWTVGVLRSLSPVCSIHLSVYWC